MTPPLRLVFTVAAPKAGEGGGAEERERAAPRFITCAHVLTTGLIRPRARVKQQAPCGFIHSHSIRLVREDSESSLSPDSTSPRSRPTGRPVCARGTVAHAGAPQQRLVEDSGAAMAGVQDTWSLLRNATAAVGALKVSEGRGGHSGGGGGGGGDKQLFPRPGTQDSLSAASPPGGISRSGSLQQSLQRSGSLLRQQSGSSSRTGPGLLLPTSSEAAAWDLPSPRSLAGSLSPGTPQGAGPASSGSPAAASGLAVDSSYNALKQSLSRMEQQNRQLSQRNGELEAALEERSRQWQQVGPCMNGGPARC
jgi:hypothetical protein